VARGALRSTTHPRLAACDMGLCEGRRCTYWREVVPCQGNPQPLQPIVFTSGCRSPSQGCLCLRLIVVIHVDLAGNIAGGWLNSRK
jgi:hypothetical protein